MPRTMTDEDTDLRALLSTLDRKACDDLRRILIRDQADRDAVSSRLMRYRDQNGQDWADIVDFLTMSGCAAAAGSSPRRVGSRSPHGLAT
jgi:hypothetical protein